MTEPPITTEMLEGADVRYAAHYNMGFDEAGKQKGYGYGYRFVAFPRLMFIDRHYKVPEPHHERWWHVDGARVADVEAAIAALNVPPVLTEEEKAALEKVLPFFKDLREVEEAIAGSPRPDGGILLDTSHHRATKALNALRDKGMVEFSDGMVRRA